MKYDKNTKIWREILLKYRYFGSDRKKPFAETVHKRGSVSKGDDE